jgi:hypothetical protein
MTRVGAYWWPTVELSKSGQRLYARTIKRRKFYCFLVDIRRELFDESFQTELLDMYRQTGAGLPPKPPALMAMATLLQLYTKASDQETIELTLDSRRWQMVLDWHDQEVTPFSQGALYDFRNRLIATAMDQRLLERTIELARKRGGFSPKSLRLALDSSPLLSAARVEDTFNLLGHATRKVLGLLTELTSHTLTTLTEEVGLSLFNESSIKAALDLDWADKDAKAIAINRLIDEVDSLDRWVKTHVAAELDHPPLRPALETLRRLRDQDIEPDPAGGYRVKIGVAVDRQVTVEDPEARHGRKSKSKRFDGFKRHIAIDLDSGMIVAAEVGKANELDAERLDSLVDAAVGAVLDVSELHIDRGYLSAEQIKDLLKIGTKVFCKPLTPSSLKGKWSKRAFKIDLEAMTITCPQEQSIPIKRLGQTLRFPKASCHGCQCRDSCIKPDAKSGRGIRIHEAEDFHQALVERQSSSTGRAQLRERVAVEHALARISRRGGNTAKYNGIKKNTFRLRMNATVQNLERIHKNITSIDGVAA